MINWRPQRDLNPRYWRERPVSWTGLDDGDAVVDSEKWSPSRHLPQMDPVVLAFWWAVRESNSRPTD
jgi:hypothetical protein